jgi:LPXTG-motif cell wall-anchored protein
VPRIVRAASIAALFTTVSAVPAAPAWASDGVDLRPSFTAPTFGAGSSLNLGSFAITNSGAVAATNVTFTIDLLSDGGTPALTFAGQLNGCTVVSASRLTCPMPDAPAGGSSAYRYGSFSAKVIETHPVPGAANPVPMPIRVRVSVSAAEHELNPADNVTISTPVMRTVSSPPTDWVADAKPGRGKVGESVDIQVGAINRGPRGVAVGETIYTYVAPSGTEWETDLPSWCFEVRPRVEYRCTSTGENPPEPGPIQYGRVRLKILNLIVGDGEFRVESMGGDINPADNAAKIVVDVEGAPPRQTPTSAAQPSHPGGATGGSGGSGGGSGLPVTGTQTALIAAVGAGIVLAGAILLLVGRRRRVRLETPAD